MKKSRIFGITVAFFLLLQFSTPVFALNASSEVEPANYPDSLLSPEIQISLSTSPESVRQAPSIAYNWTQHQYLVVWHNMWGSFYDIYARRISSSGKLLSWFCVATGANGDNKWRYTPSVAYNARSGEYLVVYMYDASGDHIHWEVWGRRVSWDGTLIGPEFQIFTWGNRSFNSPHVAWNGYRNQYLVIADAFDTQTHIYNDVVGRRVMSDGTTPFPGHSISIQSQTVAPEYADVTYNVASDEYLVVWEQYSSVTDWDIYGARVRGDNDQVVNPPGIFVIDDSDMMQGYPSVATNEQDRYIVVWTQRMGDLDVYGVELDIFGNPLGDPFAIGATLDDEGDAMVAIDGSTNERFVVWRRVLANGYQIWGSGWNPITRRIIPFLITSNGGWGNVAVSSGPPGFFTVYEGAAGNVSHIIGTLYFPFSNFLPFIKR